MTTYQVYHSTLFSYCNDVAKMRQFYVDLLGLNETYYDADKGWLTCDSGQLNLVFIRANTPITEHRAWAKQPGYKDGTLEVPSWVITVPHDKFDQIVETATHSDSMIPCYQDTPSEPRPGHHSFWVRDPMGVTVEIYATSPDVSTTE